MYLGILTTPTNFKNQSHRFMTIFSNFINQGVQSQQNKNAKIFQIEVQCTSKKHNTQHEKVKVDKKRIRMAMKVLDEVKTAFPETAEFNLQMIVQSKSVAKKKHQWKR